MVDVHDKTTRSYNMSCIRGKDTKPELQIRKYLFSKGLRYRLYVGKLPGHPDIVLNSHKTVIFVHGCFWHGHKNCKHFILPKTRTKWWKEKIENNRINDNKNTKRLKKLGYKVIVIWECKIKNNKCYKGLIDNVRNTE